MKQEIKEQMQIYEHLYKEQDDFYKRAAQKAGLSDAAHWVLYKLCSDNQEVIQSDLCKEWYFSKQTVNSAVSKLIKEGYIELKASEGKGHRKAIILTESGKKFCEKNVEPVVKAEQRAFEALTNEERGTLLKLMRKQLDILEQETENLWQ